jgi:hypothetical protein
VLKRIFGPKRNDITREWKRLHDEELYTLHSLPNIILVIKSRWKTSEVYVEFW